MAKRSEKLTVTESIALLDDCIEFARDTLDECSKNKLPYMQTLWVCSLLASMVSSARSIPLLLRSRQYWDLKLINRSIHDAFIDIQFILHDPSQTKLLVQLFEIEIAVDNYDRWDNAYKQLSEYKDSPKLDGKREKAAELLRKAALALNKAKKHPAFNATKKEWPRRWINIGQHEKLKAIGKAGLKNPTALLDHELRILGNAAAHRRTHMLQDMWKQDGDRSVKYITKPPLNKITDSPRVMVLATFASLLGATWKIIEAYHFDQSWDKRAQRLLDKWMGRLRKI